MLTPIALDQEFSEEDWAEIRKQSARTFSPALTEAEWERYKDHFSRYGMRAATHVRYSTALFRVQFIVLTTAFPGELRKEASSSWMARLRARRPNKPARPPYPCQVGYIAMLGDEPVAELDASKLPIYDRPRIRERTGSTAFFSRGGAKFLSDYRSEVTPEALSELELSLRLPEWRELLETRVARLQNANIDLTNATCRTLEDADGRAWGSTLSELRLENFTYGHIASPSTEGVVLSLAGRWLTRSYASRDRLPQRLLAWARPEFWFAKKARAETADRLNWLRKMPTKPFLLQPYTHLASVLKISGDNNGAKAIETRQIDLEVEEQSRSLLDRGVHWWPVWALHKWLWSMFRDGFSYGLSPERATVTLLLCLAVGWYGFAALNTMGYLVQNTSTSATLLVNGDNNELTAAYPRAKADFSAADLRCGGSINAFLYAVDVFIPLLDLKQESRCDVRSVGPRDIDPGQEFARQKSARQGVAHWMWSVAHAPVLTAQFLKSLYAILGWVVISLAILTYSGVLRRWSEG